MMDKRIFYQWDLDQRLALNDVAVGTEVHFCNPVSKDTECLTVFAYEDNGAVYVDVPNVILQIAGSFKVYVWPFHTTQYHQFTVITRPKPADYIYEEVEIYTIETVVNEALKKAKESGEFDGKDGYTPQKGVDYWTDADKQEIKEEVAEDFVKKTDFAGNKKAGIVNLDKRKGISFVGDNAVLTIVGATNTEIDERESVKPITTQNLDHAVKSGLTANQQELTDEEKASVQEWLGLKDYIDGEIGNIEEAIDEIIELQKSLLPIVEVDLILYQVGSTYDEPNAHYVGDGTFGGCTNGLFRVEDGLVLWYHDAYKADFVVTRGGGYEVNPVSPDDLVTEKSAWGCVWRQDV